MCICIHTAARAAFRIPFKGANGFSGVPGGGREGGQTHMSKLHYNKTQWGRGGCHCRCELLLLAALQIRSKTAT